MVAKNISVSGYSLDKIYKKAIETINTGIYSKHVYSKTHSLELSKKCDDFILMEAAYVLFLDYFYELKNKNFLRKANGIHNALLSKLKPKQQNELLKMESRVAPFFQYEKKLAVKIKTNRKFSNKEIERFTLMKSKDVCVYSIITSFFAKLPERFVTKMYHAQLVRDLGDDFRDLLEDFQQKMPNPILLRLQNKGLVNFDKKYTQKQLQSIAKISGVYSVQKKFLLDYIKRNMA